MLALIVNKYFFAIELLSKFSPCIQMKVNTDSNSNSNKALSGTDIICLL